MAIWQFTFHLFPRQAVQQIEGVTALVLGAIRQCGLDAGEESVDPPNYWAGHSTHAHAGAIEALITPRKSWASEALMFGDEQGDGIELWDDDLRVRLDIRQFNASLARAIVRFAAVNDFQLAMAESHHLLPPSYTMLLREIVQSRAYKYVRDPVATLELMAREDP